MHSIILYPLTWRALYRTVKEKEKKNKKKTLKQKQSPPKQTLRSKQLCPPAIYVRKLEKSTASANTGDFVTLCAYCLLGLKAYAQYSIICMLLDICWREEDMNTCLYLLDLYLYWMNTYT